MENIDLLTDANKEINLEIEGLKNADNVLTNNLNDNALRFHVETKRESVHWPENTLITYKTKLTDTHNAMNTETGLFTAPFSGTFGFVFYGQFYCEKEYSYLDVDHNGARSKIYNCYGAGYINGSDSGSSIYFAISLKQGDKVGIFVETVNVYLGNHPAKFTGFLLQKN